MSQRVIAFIAIAVLHAASVAAQQTAPSAGRRPEDVAPPVASAAARTGPISVNGRLDEPAWAAAPVVEHFTQRAPREGDAPTQRTVVRILYDEDAIYIGARMFEDRGAAAVVTRLVRRDAAPNSDLLQVDLDPYLDRLHHVTFSVNPSGVRGDAQDGDDSWDPVWEAAAVVDSLGWTAEMRIPLSQLHFSRAALQRWGLEIQRFIQRSNETDLWAFVPVNQELEPARYGVLEDLRFGRHPGHLELLPYASGRVQRLSSGDPASPFYEPHEAGLRVGADLRYPVTSSLTLSATVNPDFGQVEVDPAVVNLSAFETFFPEKRPFFVEGANLFEFGDPGCNINCGFGIFPFYSRRIGRPPQATSLAYGAGEHADIPQNTTILGAAKLLGRTQGGTSIGLIDAVTGAAHARVVAPDGRTLRPLVEPLTNDFAGRVKHEMFGGNLALGGIATSVHRDLSGAAIASILPRDAAMAGADGRLYWGSHTYSLYAAVAGSRVSGDSAAILRVQRSSAHYLQRPDRSAGEGSLGAAYDPGATSLQGLAAIFRLEKASGNWIGDLNGSTMTPGFETNDLGFESRADLVWTNGTFGYQFTRPTRRYRSIMLMAGAEQSWNYDGDISARDATGVVSITFPNYWSLQVVGERIGSYFDDRLTRGGPVVRRAGAYGSSLKAATDQRRVLYLSVSGTSIRNDDGAVDRSLGVTATLRPAANASISAGPALEHTRATDQFVTSVADPTATAFYGTRYVFSHLDETVASMTLRGSMTFSPSLSLDVFAQPLLASADYADFEEFAAPRQIRKLIYANDIGTITAMPGGYRIDPDGPGAAAPFTIENPDFNQRSLRGTAVLRWEWRPGSTLYLAWTQTRSGSAAVGNFDFPRDRSALVRERPDNIFLLKVSYWLGL